MSAHQDGADASGDGIPAVDIEAAFTGGDPRRLQNAETVIELVLASPDRLDELFDCVFSDDEIVRMRASDALEKVCRQRPALLRDHVDRLLVDMAEIEQPSVQWHLAQILATVPLDDEQRTRAVALLHHNLAAYDDWIVTNLTLESLAHFARDDSDLRPGFVAALRNYEHSSYKSIRSRVSKLLAEFDRPADAKASGE